MKDYKCVLEYDKVLNDVANLSATIMGAEFVRQLSPVDSLSLARYLQEQTSQTVEVLNRCGSVPLDGIEDIRQAIALSEIEAVLSPNDLIAIHNTLQSCARLRKFLLQLPVEDFSTLADIAFRMDEHTEITAEIGRTISQAGEVLDSASQSLSRIRNSIRRNHQQHTEKLQSYMQNTGVRNALQDPVITIRGDRYCLPVKSEQRSHVPGIVHDSSASGATLFIEPAALVEIGNKRRELAVKEVEEVERILGRLSILVASQSSRIESTLISAAQIDSIAARARYASIHYCTEPVLNEEGIVSLRDARHPLLVGNVVPIDVRLGSDYDALLVTGPNTGGKTVALKTIGLLSIMAASGLWVPAADGSEVSLFNNVFADIGDEQSIEQSLSTFSSHMTNIAQIADAVDSNSLVLLDEIGAGTDPAEGAALARAIIDFLLAKGAKVVATTHYGELKEYAYTTDRVQNASAEFDTSTLRPTYKLLTGVPGSSNALIIAERIGLKSEIVEAARGNIGAKDVETQELIRSIEETQRTISQDKINAEQMLAEAQELRKEYEKQVNLAAQERSKVVQKAREKTSKIIRDYSNKLDEVLLELSRQRLDQQRSQALQKKSGRLLEEMSAEVKSELGPPLQEEKIDEDELLNVGNRVRIAGMEQDVEIITPPSDGKVLVMAGAMRISVPISSLRKASGNVSKSTQVARKQPISISLQKTIVLHPEIDLRAKRVESALIDLDKFIDNAVTASAESVRIIHGKGTGAMRKAVNEYLKDCPSIKSFNLGDANDGGSGVTIAKLK